jgi:MarR family transcriptional regulator, 2-MHQ and catechol-resistance regulon repressor
MKTVDTSGIHVWLVLAKARRALEEHANLSIESAGICYSDFAVLEALLHKGPLPVNIIGKKILLTSGSITTAVDRLEERGLVTRSADAADRRTRLVSLTPEGRSVIETVFRRHKAAMERAASGLKPGERSTLITLLRTLGTHASLMLEEKEESRRKS